MKLNEFVQNKTLFQKVMNFHRNMDCCVAFAYEYFFFIFIYLKIAFQSDKTAFYAYFCARSQMQFGKTFNLTCCSFQAFNIVFRSFLVFVWIFLMALLFPPI